MGGNRRCRGIRPIGHALIALAVGAGLAGCPGDEEPKQEERVTSAPLKGPFEPAGRPFAPEPPVPGLRLSLAAEPKVTVGVSFQASQLNTDTSYIPPDTMGAVGPTHIVELINGNFEVFDKAGVSLRSLDLDSFWSDVIGAPVENGFTGDPRIVFDPISGRFFASSIDVDRDSNGNLIPGNNVYLARSDSSDPTGDWDGVRFAADSEGPAQFHDFDTLALDADGVYLCTVDFIVEALDGSKSCYSIPKADLLLVEPSLANMTRLEELPPDLALMWNSPQPALDFGPSDGRAALLGVSFGVFGHLLRGDILGAGAAGATVGDVETILGDPGDTVWAGARQPPPSAGRNRGFDAGPTIRSNVVEHGDSLWAVRNVKGSGSNAAVRWYEIDERTNTLLQTGLIEDPLQDYIYPSIAVNALGQVVIGYTCSGPSLAASTCVSAGETQAGVTEFDPPLLLRAGAGFYFQDYGTGRNRWGDYSATVVDPADPCTFWTFQEFVAEAAIGAVGGLWGTQITQLSFASCGEAVVRVVKTLDGEPDGVFDDDPSGWTFDVRNGIAEQTTTDASGELSFRVPPGLSSVTESGGPPGDSGLWLVNASCIDDANGLPLPGAAVDEPFGPTLSGVAVALDLLQGDSITCSFQNQRMAGSLTGGGQIRDDGVGRRVSFTGDVGVATDGTLRGEFQAQFHDVGNASLSGSQFEGTRVDGLVFGSNSEDPPDPPPALFNEVHFRVSGGLNELPCQLSVDGTDHGEPPSGDAIRLRLDCPGSLLDYDSVLDFPEQEAVGMHGLDSGNLQIHPPE